MLAPTSPGFSLYCKMCKVEIDSDYDTVDDDDDEDKDEVLTPNRIIIRIVCLIVSLVAIINSIRK